MTEKKFVKIPSDIHKEVKIQAIREDMTVEHITEKALRQYMRTKNKDKSKAA